MADPENRPDAGSDAGSDAGVIVDAGAPDSGTSDTGVIQRPPQRIFVEELSSENQKLWTKVWLSEQAFETQGPILVERTPYIREERLDAYAQQAALYNARGYSFVLQAVRGTYRSQGAWEPFEHEVEDGGALMDWVFAQPWSNDRVGTLGCSYPGYTAITAAIADPRVAAVYADGPAESEAFTLQGGVMSLESLSWLHLVEVGAWMDSAQLSVATNTLDLRSIDVRLLGAESYSWQSLLDDPTPESDYIQSASLAPLYPDLCTPTLVTDSGERSSHHVWRGIFDRSCPATRDEHRLLVVPGTHCAPSAKMNLNPLPTEIAPVWAFLDSYLTDTESEVTPRVSYRPLGSLTTALSTAAAYPPVNATELTLYLHGNGAVGGSLTASVPTTEASSTFLVNPAVDDPCTSLWQLQYLSAPLGTAVTVVGRPKIEFWGSGTKQDADFFAAVGVLETSDLLADGGIRARYRNGYLVEEPLSADVPVQLTILSERMIGQRVEAGNRLALLFRGTKCGYGENPHTGEPAGNQLSQWESSSHRVYSGPSRPSRIVLPVLP